MENSSDFFAIGLFWEFLRPNFLVGFFFLFCELNRNAQNFNRSSKITQNNLHFSWAFLLVERFKQDTHFCFRLCWPVWVYSGSRVFLVNFDRAMKFFFTVLAIRCLCLDAGPAVSLQDPAGQELIFLRLAINVAMAGPFALVENESLAWVSGFKFVQTFWYVFAIFWWSWLISHCLMYGKWCCAC